MAPAEPRPDLSIVIVNYNAGDLLVRCVRSVHENTRDVSLECVVVDNASWERESLRQLKGEFPETTLIENAENLGFARGSNAGLEVSRGRHLLLLNPDTSVGEGALDEMVRFLDAHPDVAVLGSPLAYPDGRDQRVAGRGFPTPLASIFGRTTLLTRWFPNNRFSRRFSSRRDPSRKEPFETDWVSGACMMVRREAIDEVGPIDPGFFFMWEDADWCYRMKAAGWKVYCLDAANVFHHEGACRQRDYRTLWLTTVAFHRGVYRYYRKHINPRRYDPTHLLVMAGLAMRGAIVLTSRVFKLLRNGAQTSPEPRRGASHPADSRISS